VGEPFLGGQVNLLTGCVFSTALGHGLIRSFPGGSLENFLDSPALTSICPLFLLFFAAIIKVQSPALAKL